MQQMQEVVESGGVMSTCTCAVLEGEGCWVGIFLYTNVYT